MWNDNEFLDNMTAVLTAHCCRFGNHPHGRFIHDDIIDEQPKESFKSLSKYIVNGCFVVQRIHIVFIIFRH